MPKPPGQPTNLVLEQLRIMREENRERFDRIDKRFSDIETDIRSVKVELRGLNLNTIAEVYKANLTVASFADHEQRIQALEQKNRAKNVIAHLSDKLLFGGQPHAWRF